MLPTRLIVALSLVTLVACSARVDEHRYAVGDPAVATFDNASDATAWLGGCFSFHFQKSEMQGWVDRGTPIDCIWEGFAQPVPAHGTRVDSFVAPSEPGTWRLRYPTGLRCAADHPLSPQDCQSVRDVVTEPFIVAALCEPSACGPVLGLPKTLCPDGSMGGPTGRCLRGLKTRACGWEFRSCSS